VGADVVVELREVREFLMTLVKKVFVVEAFKYSEVRFSAGLLEVVNQELLRFGHRFGRGAALGVVEMLPQNNFNGPFWTDVWKVLRQVSLHRGRKYHVLVMELGGNQAFELGVLSARDQLKFLVGGGCGKPWNNYTVVGQVSHLFVKLHIFKQIAVINRPIKVAHSRSRPGLAKSGLR